MTPKPEVAVLLTSAHRVQQDRGVVAADPDGADVDGSVAVEAGHGCGDGFVEQRVATGQVVEGAVGFPDADGERPLCPGGVTVPISMVLRLSGCEAVGAAPAGLVVARVVSSQSKMTWCDPGQGSDVAVLTGAFGTGEPGECRRCGHGRGEDGGLPGEELVFLGVHDQGRGDDVVGDARKGVVRWCAG